MLASLVLSACASAGTTSAATESAASVPVQGAGAATKNDESWLTTIDVEHPLVGRIWDARAKTFVGKDAVLARASAARFVLLGEKHDNPDHHRLQAFVLNGLVHSGKRPHVLFEMLDVDRQSAVDAYSSTPLANASGFGTALAWDKSGWPSFAEYRPIFEVAFAARLPLVAANLEQDRARALVHEGLTALTPERATLLALDRPFPPELERELEAELRADHCGMLPASMLGPMALAQHARDAQMARRLLDTPPSEGAVLIAGNGHVRRDRGVPYYLALNGVSSVLALEFLEVDTGVDAPEPYLPNPGAGASIADFVWFTPRASDADPCAAFGAKPKAR